VLVFELEMQEKLFFGSPIVRGLADFKARSDVIVANRPHEDLDDVCKKAYSRDLRARD
jgi:UDPglucose 6-dehydrogenase